MRIIRIGFAENAAAVEDRRETGKSPRCYCIASFYILISIPEGALMFSKRSLPFLMSVASIIAVASCGDDDSSDDAANGGSAGSGAGTAGSGAGTAGTGAGGGGNGGSAGSAGAAGDAGSAGAAGTGGSAGSAGSAGDADAGTADAGDGGNALGFFVASASDSGGDLGGIDGADALCETLADEVGAGARTWRAYLSTTGDDGEDAADRIGDGPWANANGVIIADDIAELHALDGDVELFIDHEGEPINGQWAGSPTPNQHDILTGSNPDGTAADDNCDNWTSDTATPGPIVGHSDGLGPGMNSDAPFNSWNSSHAPAGCSQAQLNAVGGAGRIYCFAAD